MGIYMFKYDTEDGIRHEIVYDDASDASLDKLVDDVIIPFLLGVTFSANSLKKHFNSETL